MKLLNSNKSPNILIASESRNPYVAEISNGLLAFFQVRRSVKDFLYKKGKYDIIHIQWPEELTSWSIPTEESFQKVEDALKYWSSKAKVVVTRHNILPNKNQPLKYVPLYDLVYSYADAIIHLGEWSLQEFNREYPQICRECLQRVIPHPIYEGYPNIVSRTNARQYLNISEKDKVILCFGSIRDKNQFRMVFKAFRTLEIPNKCLLIPRYKDLINRSRRYFLSHFWFFLKQLYYRNFYNIRLGVGFIENRDIQYYFKASDVVFIPRSGQLNSGVIFLALAFGKPVIGPARGNMEEVLKAFGYPVFEPEDNVSIVSALKKSIRDQQDAFVPFLMRNLDQYTLSYCIARHKELYLQIQNEGIGQNEN